MTQEICSQDSKSLLKTTRKADITKFAVDLGKTALIFNVDLKKERIQAYYDILSEDCTEEEINHACKILTKTFKSDYGVKFPLPVHFYEIINDSRRTPVEELGVMKFLKRRKEENEKANRLRS